MADILFKLFQMFNVSSIPDHSQLLVIPFNCNLLFIRLCIEIT